MSYHHCTGSMPSDGYGPAVTDCVEAPAKIDDVTPHTLWVGNGEYFSAVNFCPFCGFQATVKASDEFTEDGRLRSVAHDLFREQRNAS